MLQAFLSAVVLGFAIGGLARWAVPGPDPMPAWLTIFIGLTGSLLGGGVTAAVVGTKTRGDLFATVMASIGAEGGPRPLPQKSDELEQQENLRKLEDLWRAGILTDDEFQAKRAQLLS